MNGWLLICIAGAAACVIALTVIAVDGVQQRMRRKAWDRAIRVAAFAPDLVAQVAAEEADPTEAAQHVASIDQLPHDALVDSVLAGEQREQELVEQVEEIRTEAVAVIADVMVARDKEHTEAVRQERAKRRHWSTVKRLKRGNA